MIKSITIEGYKSIRKLQDFELKNLNVIIGANAAGKSNFISFLKMVKTQLTGDIQSYIRRYENSMEHVAFMGTAVTPKVNGKIVRTVAHTVFPWPPRNPAAFFSRMNIFMVNEADAFRTDACHGIQRSVGMTRKRSLPCGRKSLAGAFTISMTPV